MILLLGALKQGEGLKFQVLQNYLIRVINFRYGSKIEGLSGGSASGIFFLHPTLEKLPVLVLILLTVLWLHHLVMKAIVFIRDTRPIIIGQHQLAKHHL